ncbi:MAG: glycosyltransferase family 4 protein, partial [Phormidesmis sp.]
MRKIAIVHEWFTSHAGSEKVVEQILRVYPNADLYSLVDFLSPEQREFIQHKPVTTSFIQSLP